MKKAKTIRVYEHCFLKVGVEYEGVNFEQRHFKALAVYLTHESNTFYTLYYDKVRFNQYVGVIQIGDLTIEVLPKADNHTDDKLIWRRALVEMLAISLQVTAKTTTVASIDVKKLSVLEAYLLMFLNEVERLCHHGLIKKYRRETGNQSSLKGRLLVHKQPTENLVHAERFYVSYSVYDRDNIYNSILLQALQVIDGLPISPLLRSKSAILLLNYPECKSVPISERLFSSLVYDRKTASYKDAIELARIILLNYHPDFKGGHNNILAIMVDMNLLWENYVYFILRWAQRRRNDTRVLPQQNALFWQHPDKWNLRLRPDIVIKWSGKQEVTYVLDTKWKYRKATSTEDIRQMYAYGHFFNGHESYLVYPDSKPGAVKLPGTFYSVDRKNELSKQKCGLIYLDLFNDNGRLDFDIGSQLLDCLYSDSSIGVDYKI